MLHSPSTMAPKHPLTEVFGFTPNNMSGEAVRHRSKKLCPFNNKVPNCTKDKASDPLGTCSVLAGDGTAITCPIRFRERWIIADDAADFFFPRNTKWTSLIEVRLKDKQGKSAGNIDLVLVSYNDKGKITDFGALEVQAVCISGNIRKPFEYYMQDPKNRWNMNWKNEEWWPAPDYVSSSRKRLAPQLIFKSGILHTWKKKTAVALDTGFFATLPKLKEVPGRMQSSHGSSTISNSPKTKASTPLRDPTSSILSLSLLSARSPNLSQETSGNSSPCFKRSSTKSYKAVEPRRSTKRSLRSSDLDRDTTRSLGRCDSTQNFNRQCRADPPT